VTPDFLVDFDLMLAGIGRLAELGEERGGEFTEKDAVLSATLHDRAGKGNRIGVDPALVEGD
jgi:hypothetical protein